MHALFAPTVYTSTVTKIFQISWLLALLGRLSFVPDVIARLYLSPGHVGTGHPGLSLSLTVEPHNALAFLLDLWLGILPQLSPSKARTHC